MKPLVIAFLARAGGGKTTAAQFLVAQYGARRISFAGPLKELAKRLWVFTDEQVWGDQSIKETIDPRCGITPREAMQRLGEGARQLIAPNVWVTACITQILQQPEVTLWVIDDARYVNEAVELATNPDIRGYVIKLVCPDAPVTANPLHPSEAEVDQVPERYIAARIESCRSPGSRDLLEKVDAVFQALRQ